MLVPCVWLDDQAEAAAALYTELFPGGRTTAVARYPEATDNPSGRPRGSVLTIEVELAGQRCTLLNGGPMFTLNPSLSLFVQLDDSTAARRLFGRLAEGGEVRMPLDQYPWSPCYGWVQDRFGVSWQVITGRRAPAGDTIVPCLMFAGAQHGRAEEALRRYAAIFPDGRVDSLEPYGPDEGPAGTLKHGRCTLAGHELVAMDSHLAHDVAFNEALSLQVMCADQAEVDRCWDALVDGGTPGPCGWLKDRFGVSWQVVPSAIAAWMAGPDTAARDRAFAAMLTMGKLDVAALERAFTGA
ncbi:MAG: VOC family protein [Myxococcales bacterium]|nr:VOC family protein [Myxococcales bacterium]